MPPVEIVVKHGDRKLKFELEEKKVLERQTHEEALFRGSLMAIFALAWVFLNSWVSSYVVTGPLKWTVRLYPMFAMQLGALVTGEDYPELKKKIIAGCTLQSTDFPQQDKWDTDDGIIRVFGIGIMAYSVLTFVAVYFFTSYFRKEKTVDLDRLKPTL